MSELYEGQGGSAETQVVAVPYISYEDFGRRFLDHAASPQRIAGAFEKLTGEAFEFGPIGAGPGKLAKLSAAVRLGQPRLNREVGDIISFDLVIPRKVDLLIDLAVDRYPFRVDGTIHLHLTVRTAEPLRVLIEIDEPQPSNVRINVASATRRGELLRIVASVDHEIRRFVARYIATEICKPNIQAATAIDVAARLDAAWKL
ncbi:hypothetical protein [Nocardia seriolae]|uniref:hypothetical protein n=1 Tax=Nocardia seriolae TaxID=37332 RepID=UPI0008FF434A|nr:hypothetical protein [Nocardia seriolae]OJF82697.1 hypothetical protein NS14008_30625 [Nocardia seriolae]PSK30202.1 hypothetical protein C6575_16810 [Nocardia seriolae]QOW33453.1 hypothetical protein IMZ23_37775 [Nocardia seriolae]QUN20800.1 hypothetical protein KEC46_17055 [Nocardia seriolae]WNJ60326.1 hypothetical protein RMO66_05960 [Nocardia seriolae]